jgi:5-methylcytosine-specific restriction endonuclease McrA
MNEKHSREYLQYMQSLAWYAKRREKLASVGNRCERCGKSGKDVVLEIHHLSYRHLGNEPLEDLQALCFACHDKADAERRKKVEEEAEDRLYEARLDGWARKRYGENWWLYRDRDAVADAFDRWLEKREQRDAYDC